jgi:hypothetical protein
MKVHIEGSARELERLGVATVFRTPSKTRQGLFHYQTVFTNGRGTLCSCEGFTYQKGNCWHIDKIPLCLDKEPVVQGRYVAPQECRFVDQHEGAHSWEKQAVTK